MKVELYEIQQKGNKYCGPSVLSALTGLPTNQCTNIIRNSSGKQTAVRGLSDAHMWQTLSALGFAGREHSLERMNLRSWVRQKKTLKSGVFLVVAGNHYILVRGMHAMCGISKELVHVDDHPYARKFVTKVYELYKVKQVDASKMITIIPSRTNSEASARTKAKKIASEIGVVIERDVYLDSKPFMVWPPKSLADDPDLDPFYGDHYRYDWTEILEMVLEYQKALSK